MGQRNCSLLSQSKTFTCKVSPRLDNTETDGKIRQLNHCLVNLLSDVEGVNIIDAVRHELRLFNKDGIHLSCRGLSLQAKIMVKKLYSVINQSDVKTGKEHQILAMVIESLVGAFLRAYLHSDVGIYVIF